MDERIVIANKQGQPVKTGHFSEPEIRMAAKAGYRVFKGEKEITQSLTGLFAIEEDSDQQ